MFSSSSVTEVILHFSFHFGVYFSQQMHKTVFMRIHGLEKLCMRLKTKNDCAFSCIEEVKSG